MIVRFAKVGPRLLASIVVRYVTDSRSHLDQRGITPIRETVRAPCRPSLHTRLGIASAERFFDLFPQRVFWSVAHNFAHRPPTTEENQRWASHNPVLVSQPPVVLVGEHIESYELDVLIFLSKFVENRFHAATPVTSLMPEVDDYKPS